MLDIFPAFVGYETDYFGNPLVLKLQNIFNMKAFRDSCSVETIKKSTSLIFFPQLGMPPLS